MKKNFLLIAMTALAVHLNAQTAPENTARFELGSGLNLSYGNGNYAFKLGGMIQPYFGFQKAEGQDAAYMLNSKRTYFNIGGEAKEEKVKFFLQLDFSQSRPLLDAWVKYMPWKGVEITGGQMLTPANNREMTFMETNLQFPDRSLLSQSFSNTGREFALAISYQFMLGPVGIQPQLVASSGDGRNSFGADSRDVDLGGFKYGFRFDVFPLGLFAEGNDLRFADLGFEQKPKLVLGVAGSFNDGANDPVGEGHNNLELYNGIGELQFPDYRKLSIDALFKFKGFSFLGEYMVATATNLEGLFTTNTGTSPLTPTVISQYLNLGNAFAAHAGFVMKNGIGIDARYAARTPEFTTNAASLISDANTLDIGLSKYMMKNALKFQVSYTKSSMNNQNMDQVGFLTQLWF